MYRSTITIPRHYNDGREVPADVTSGIESEILDVFGGFTVTESRGAWRDGDTVYVEPVGVYTCDSDADESGAVERIAETVAELLSQEAVYVTHAAPDGAQTRAFVERAPIFA